MAHFEKYTMPMTRQKINHDRRKYIPKEDDKHIDHGRTHLNYNLAPSHDPWQFVKDKIAMSKKSGGRVNSRTVSCVSCVVTLPKNFKGDTRLFFETAKKHLDNVFGVDNCISAWVHVDESQPHLHYKTTPVKEKVDDKGRPTGVMQFNAKAVCSRSLLKRFHKDLEKAMTAVFGHPVGILNGACTEGALTVPQLKNQQKAFLQLNKDFSSLLDEYNNLVDEYNKLLEDVDGLESEKSQLVAKVEELKKKLQATLDENAKIADDILRDDDDWCR